MSKTADLFFRQYFFINHFRFIAFVCLLMQVQMLSADDLVPLKILLNTQDKGEYFVLLKSNNDVWITEEDFQTLGILHSGFSQEVDEVKYIALNELNDQLEYYFDEKSLSVFINIDPSLLGKTLLDLSQKTVVTSNPFGIDSAFLNYSLLALGSSNQTLKSINTPLEGVISAHDMLLEMNFNYRQVYNADGKFIDGGWSRGITSITKDYPKKLNRLVFGDVRGSSGELGGSNILMGMSFGKKFSMATYFTKYPSVSIEGLLRTPSTVNMYVNGILVRSEALPPGEFHINNLPNLYGAGRLEMETIDAFGRVVRRSIPYYVSTKMLRVGLSDFLYTVGFTRLNSLTSARAEYATSPTILGYHRYGFSRYLTVGYRFEYSDKLKNIGSSANILLGAFGEAEFGFSYSKSLSSGLATTTTTDFNTINSNEPPVNREGRAGYFRYGFTSRYVHGQYSYRQRTKNYNHVGNIGGENEVTDPLHSVGFGVHGLPVGSLGLRYDIKGSFEDPRDRIYSVIYSLRLAKQVSLIARATRTEDEFGIMKDAFIVSISGSLGKKVSLNASYARDEENIKSSVHVQKSVPIGTGFGGRIRLDRTESIELLDGGSETNLGAGYLTMKGKYLSVTGEYSLGENENNYNSQMAGALAFIDNDFYLTRPIQDSFGLAKVSDLDDVGVYFGSELVGETSNGRLLIPNLVSYADNYITIDGQDVPVDRALKNTFRRVSPKFRTGSVALFDVEKFQGFFGFIFLENKGIRKTADYAHLELQKDGSVFDTVVGKGGEFYLENLSVGNYSAETRLDGETCRFNVKIPESKEMMVELGSYDCKYEK